MEFERIGKNTVQCHMTVEEMNEYGFAIEDFFTNQEKSRVFLEQLVERAEEEVGYEVESGMVSMQLMKMPDDSLVITFSDRGEEGIQGMLDQIQNLTGIIESDETLENQSALDAVEKEIAAAQENDSDISMNQHSESGNKDKRNATGNNQVSKEEYARHAREVEKKYLEKQKKQQGATKVFRFKSLSLIENFAATIQLEKNISSKLYKEESTGLWYLLVKKGKLKLEEYQSLCQRLAEYATLCSQQPYVEQYCKEHYQCVMCKHALKKVKEYI